MNQSPTVSARESEDMSFKIMVDMVLSIITCQQEEPMMPPWLHCPILPGRVLKVEELDVNSLWHE
ncbi:hypothetical protein ABVK25_007290 [Lepraria finkii]|uniref:Uncharacterized protein n=1 Tax=Lepraria finkii TaxID=1340010 RepID=A0ABR4B999_9LECA